ncbi:hypothetical protein Tdes44962_MAKER07342 [Teratosphaeria destructans]|uniref:Uncharacterized protein n=1 Tax=Teratosphaeria destructans TaxID=418781 RepID=A0A9W7W5Z3_9PEZI|nr:hypothetical protein Tdes44962_MAKER07342 [Teratosphaeria destructans]
MTPSPNELRQLVSAAQDLMEENKVSESVRGWYEMRPHEVGQKRMERSRAIGAVDKQIRESSAEDETTTGVGGDDGQDDEHELDDPEEDVDVESEEEDAGVNSEGEEHEVERNVDVKAEEED